MKSINQKQHVGVFANMLELKISNNLKKIVRNVKNMCGSIERGYFKK